MFLKRAAAKRFRRWSDCDARNDATKNYSLYTKKIS